MLAALIGISFSPLSGCQALKKLKAAKNSDVAVVTPVTPVEPTPVTPGPTTADGDVAVVTPVTPVEPTPVKPGPTTADGGLASPVVTALAGSSDNKLALGAVELPLTASLIGSAGAPTVKIDDKGRAYEITIDGMTYPLRATKADFVQGEPFALSMVGVGADGDNNKGAVGFVGSGPKFGDISSGYDVKRFDLVFMGTPTNVQDLPNSTASYKGTFEVAFLRSDGADYDAGDFSATADFGSAQKITGTFKSMDNGVMVEQARLDAGISGNSFSGNVIATGSEAKFNAGGIFVGPGAASVLGAAQGAAKDTDGSDYLGLLAFQGDKQ